MCGRYTLRTGARQIVDDFGLLALPALTPRYNIAPTQPVPVIRRDRDSGSRQLDLLHWGLIPSWADDPKIASKMINARADGVATKPSFRKAFQQRRCLVVADGFYEWQKVGSKRQPFYIHRPDGRPFAFAGLWEHWRRGELMIDSCTIITTEANQLRQPLHDRMPVILQPEDYDQWLDPNVQASEALEPLLRPAAEDLLEAYPVSTTVNKPANDVAECIERTAQQHLW
jgi:putative SOS response-associated peptidase YedK